MQKILTNNRQMVAIFVAIFAFLWLTNYLLPPLSDDFAAQQAAKNGFSSAKNSYLHWNGRIGELLHSALVAGFPPSVFDPLNAAIGTGFILAFFVLVFGRLPRDSEGFDATAIALICLSILVQAPFGAVFLWGAGALNYLWGIFFIMLFLLPFRLFAGRFLGVVSSENNANGAHIYGGGGGGSKAYAGGSSPYSSDNPPLDSPKHPAASKNPTSANPLSPPFPNFRPLQNRPLFALFAIFYIAFSFFAGMASEHIGVVSIAAVAVLLGYLKLVKKAKIPLFLCLAFAFFIAGFCALYFSPGHAARATNKVFDGFFMTLPQLLDLSLGDKIKRIFLTMRGFRNSAYLPVTLLAFSIAFWRLSGAKIARFADLKSHKLLIFVFVVGLCVIFFSNRGDKGVAHYFITFGLLLLLLLQDRRFLGVFVLHLIYLACMAATVQFPGLPHRARLGDTMLLIAMTVLLLRLMLCYWAIARAVRVLLVLGLCAYGAWVVSAYARFRVDWNAAVAHIEAEKARGNLDVTVEAIFHSPYRRFGNWDDIGPDPNFWANIVTAQRFGLKSIRTKQPAQ